MGQRIIVVGHCLFFVPPAPLEKLAVRDTEYKYAAIDPRDELPLRPLIDRRSSVSLQELLSHQHDVKKHHDRCESLFLAVANLQN